MPEFVNLFLVFVVGVIASVIGTLVGGGGLLSIPFLMMIGLPPQVAIATDRFGSLGQVIMALFKFSKSGKIKWKYVPIFTVLAIFGSLIGAHILLSIDTELLKTIVAFIILSLVPIILIDKKVGVSRKENSKLQICVGLALYFLVQIYAGFFGGGTGTLIIYLAVFFLGFTVVEVSATGLVPWFVSSCAVLFVFMREGLVNYKYAIFLFLGMAVGGYIGAHLALEKGDAWVKKVFVIMVLAVSIKLIFF